MTKKDVAIVQSMQELSAQVQNDYKDIVAGIQSKVGLPSGNAIRITQDKKFTLPDGTKTGGPISVIIVGFTSRNVYYTGAYNANNIVPPDCYAEGDNPASLVASADADMVQADTCAECPMNQFGSAQNGKGKACQNQRIVAVLPAGEPNAEIMTLRVSPSAIQGFDAYVRQLADKYNVPPFAVVTQVSFDTKETYAKLIFSDPTPNPLYKEVGDRAAECIPMLKANFTPATEPSTSTVTAAPVRGKGRR